MHIKSPQVLVRSPVLRQLDCGPSQLPYFTQHEMQSRAWPHAVWHRPLAPEQRRRAFIAAAPECSSSFTSSRSNSVNASAVAPEQ